MLNLHQRLSQTQRLSPQQIQYIKLLQLPTLALEQRIKAEMEINPLLEEGEDLETETLEEQTESEDFDDVQQEEDTSEDEFEWEELMDQGDDLYGYKACVDQGDDEDRRDSPMVAVNSMTEHLRDQLSFLNLSEEDGLIADQIIGSIDEDGYLRRPLESIVDDVAFNQGVLLTEEDVEEAITNICRCGTYTRIRKAIAAAAKAAGENHE